MFRLDVFPLRCLSKNGKFTPKLFDFIEKTLVIFHVYSALPKTREIESAYGSNFPHVRTRTQYGNFIFEKLFNLFVAYVNASLKDHYPRCLGQILHSSLKRFSFSSFPVCRKRTDS